MSDQEQFDYLLAKAKELNAIVVEYPDGVGGPPADKLSAWASDPRGGCGLDECRCSPGLWVSVKYQRRLFTAHFGADYKDNQFSRQDFHAWEAFVDEAGIKE